MRNKRYWFLGLLVAIALTVASGDRSPLSVSFSSPSSLAQAPISAPAKPSPTQPSPLPVAVPLTPVATPPLPLAGTYQDPAGRFKVGLLKGYTVSPIAGSVLVEATDGNLAYAVVTQAQPQNGAIGLSPGVDNENLATVATTVFHRGEGFQPGVPQPETGGGMLMNWTGSLTIAGKAQPIGGIVLVRPSPKHMLLLIVTATEAGAGQVQPAIETLAPSLQAL
ncbi:hypothetical protein [Stenomitos frigidus]|uniref:Uncharacterized protein n=1 Tax=Stenomitos frigidus ULC18 TaxID=2107698 RepID=A0A2T1ED36_9CYAN|nr:hypothetical protein [Stenomitos frigidus]PSB30667.1 hypothetical protein C7B82_08325 [Stenomitos frigidus ULC18]